MIHKTEAEEVRYLEKVRSKLKNALKNLDEKVLNYSKELQEQKRYLYENKSGMDKMEKFSVRQSVAATAISGEIVQERKRKIYKLLDSPWFGRIDFSPGGDGDQNPFYIGIYAYFDEQDKDNLIHDWRAPVSSLFYDFENGPAFYETPERKIEGILLLRRQYRIRNGRMEYMLESSLSIHDDILQKELSKSSDEKMNQIVATIQRSQNAIIRNETSRELIIQGVAGSGKTSIALHRIAFLLYRFREDISSKEILILSPNKVFADYISNVLPELGEEQLPEMGMEELASRLLEGKYRFQSFYQQNNKLLEKRDRELEERIRLKSSFLFINKLNEYLSYIENYYFTPKLLMVNRHPVPAGYVEERFRAWFRLPLFARFNKVADDIERDLLFFNRYQITVGERNELRKSVRGMFRVSNLRDLYKDYYAWMGLPHMLKMAAQSTYEYSDVFPFIYLKIRLEGVVSHSGIKHLIVDEMQDYSPVQYAVLSRLFSCSKTILGDVSQSVNLFSSAAEDIVRIFPGADVMVLNKSYRSTFEIITFARSIVRNADLEPMERHGEQPELISCRNRAEELNEIKRRINAFKTSDFNSLGIICRTHKQATLLYHKLKLNNPEIVMLNEDSSAFSAGVMVCSVHMSKGLEFDQVLIPGADAKNYSGSNDRSLLYIACTRAMHKLFITFVNEKSAFLDGNNNFFQ